MALRNKENNLASSGGKSDLRNILLVDVFAALLSAGLIASPIAILDKAIFSNASGRSTLLNSVKKSCFSLFKEPVTFFRSPAFLCIFGVYSGTYFVANTVQTLFKENQRNWEIPTFIASSITNIALSLTKDGYFTKVFGLGTPRPVGFPSYICYSIRDASTIYCSFVLPDKLSGLLEKRGYSERVSRTTSQLVAPCAIQILSTPIHLYGMDLYNNPTNTIPQRISFIKKEYFKTLAARVGRILPAFGIGGVTNRYIRSKYTERY